MSILIKDTWKEIIETIFDYINEDPAIYIQFLEIYYKTLNINLAEKSDVLNDSTLASIEVQSLHMIAISEQSCIKILQDFYYVIKNDYGLGFSTTYKNNIVKTLSLYNLRYSVTQDCKISLSIKGLIDSMIIQLQNGLVKQGNVNGFEQLEYNVASLENNRHSVSNCLSSASNLIESAVKSVAYNKARTLGKALDNLDADIFPYESLLQSLKEINTFLNNYTDLRHDGDITKKIRDLQLKDASLVTTLIIAYTYFMRSPDDGTSLIDGKLE